MGINLSRLWYGRHPLRWALWPLSLLYQSIVSVRRVILTTFFQRQFPVPIIVIGNLTVGGVGKTPLVIALAQALQEKGLRVGIVSRGYKAHIKNFPHAVSISDTALDVGDEPLLIAQKTSCPVVISPKRVDAVHFLLEKFQCQIIISDDGLQHYKMGRAIEIVVIDGNRGLGNNMSLPAGPLREKASRLKRVDFVVVNSGYWPNAYQMTLQPGQVTQLTSNKPMNYDRSAEVAAVAAIGNPSRFFATLTEMGIVFKPYIFPDHHTFVAEDLSFEQKTVIMTEKDAVKCRPFAADTWFFLPVTAKVDESFWQTLWEHKHIKGYF